MVVTARLGLLPTRTRGREARLRLAEAKRLTGVVFFFRARHGTSPPLNFMARHMPGSEERLFAI